MRMTGPLLLGLLRLTKYDVHDQFVMLVSLIGVGAGAVPTMATPQPWTENERIRWIQTITNQRHFNTLIIQSRVLTNTVSAGITTVALTFTRLEYGFVVASGIMLALFAFLSAIGKINNYYWQLLVASVKYGEGIEKTSGMTSIQIQTMMQDGKEKLINAYGLTDYIHQAVDESWAKKTVESFDKYLRVIALVIAGVLVLFAVISGQVGLLWHAAAS